jgi:hypothetical protein
MGAQDRARPLRMRLFEFGLMESGLHLPRPD